MASALYQAVAPQAAYDLTQPVDPDYGRFVEEGQVSRGLKNALLGVSAGSAADAYWQARAANDMPRAQANYLRAQQLAAEAEQAAPRVRSLRDIHGVGDAVDWGAGVMGSLPVSAVPAMGGGLAGGVLGGLVAGPAGAAIGSHLGSSAGMYPQMRDAARLQQMQDEQQGAVPVAPQRVLDDTSQQGMLQAGIEGLVPGLAARSVVRGTAGNVLRQPMASAAKRIGRDIALDTGAAGVSEGVAMGYETGRNPQRDTSGDNWRLADAMAGEAVGGAGFGVIGHAGDVAHNVLGTGAAAAGDVASYAARVGKQGVLGAGQMAKQAWQQRPQSLDEAAVMAGEGAAALHGKAEDVITRFTNRDPDVSTLLTPQKGMKAGDLRADDATKHTAARRMRDKVMAAPDEYPQFVHDALAQYEQGTKSMDSWRPVADAMNDYKRGQGIGDALQKFAQEASLKLGEGAARVMNAKDDALDAYKVKRAVDGRANAQTPDMGHMITDARDEFSPLLDETLAPYTGQKTPDGQAHVLPVLGHAMREWVSNGFSMRPDGEPVVPRALLNMFTNPAEAVTKTVELMHKQGLVDDKVLPLQTKVLERLDVMRMAKEHVGIVIDENLLPTAAKGLSAVDHDLIAEDFMDQIERDKIDSAKARELFGPRARLVLDALRAQMDDARLAERGTEYMPNGGESKGAHGLEDEANQGGLDYEGLAQMTSSRGDEPAPLPTYHAYHPGSKGTLDAETGELKGYQPMRPYQYGKRVKNKPDKNGAAVPDTLHDAHAAKRMGDLAAANGSNVTRMGYLDYLREKHGSDSDAIVREFSDFMGRNQGEIDRLRNKSGRMADMADGGKQVVHDSVDETVNKHWYVLREEQKSPKGESTNVDPAEFKDLRPFRNRWVEEASGEKGTAERGRIWLERVDEDGTRTPFATSAARIISNMLGAKKAEGEGASSSLVDQHELLHQGLASLLVALTPEGKTGRVGFKDKADGPVRWLKDGEDLPDNLRMYSSSGGAYQDAKAAREARRKDALFVDAREALKGWVDRLGHMDPGSYSEGALREQVAAMNDALSRSDAKGVDEILRGAEHARMTADDSKRVKGKLTLKKFATKKAAQAFARGQDVRVVREQLADGSAGGWKVERTVTTPRVEEKGGSDTSEMGKTSEFRTRQEDSPDDGAERYYDETTGAALHPDKDALAEKAKAAEAVKETRAKRTEFILDGLRKGVPAFNEVVRKLAPERQALVVKHLQAMLDAQSTDNPIWGGKPPKDMAAFAKRARMALDLRGVDVGAQVLKPKKADTRNNAQTPGGTNDDAKKSSRTDRGFVAAVRRQGDEFRRTLEARGFDPANTPFEVFNEGTDFGPAKGSHWLVYRGRDGLTHAFSVAQELVPQLQRLLSRPEFQNETRALNAMSYFAIQHAMFDPVKKTFDTLGPMAGSPAHKLHANSIEDTGLKLPSGEPLLRVLGTTPRELIRFAGATLAFHEAHGGKVGDVTWERVSGARVKNTGTTREGSAKFNKQDPKHGAFGIATSEPASQAEQDAFHANIMKRLGPGMKSGLVEMLYGKNAKGKDIMLSGKWEKGAIYASVYARNLGQIGAHESFHEFFSRMNGVPEAKGVMDILERAANAPYVVRQLERLLDGETEALKQIKQGAKHSVEERMAYMFQFHQAGLLKIGPETENVFTRIAAFLRKVAGLLNDDERADLLLRKFDQGWMHTPDAAARVLAESVTARQHMYESVNAAFKPALQKMSRLVNTAETNLESTGNPAYKEIRRMFKRSVGEDGAQGFLDAKDHQMKLWGSKLANVFEGLHAKDLELAAPYLHTNEKATDPAVKQLIARLKGPDGLLPAMHKYLKEAGVQRWQDDGNGKGHWEPMGKIDHGYFPRAYDTAKIVTNVDEFVADLVKYNESELAAIAAEQNKLLVDSVGKDATLVTTTDVAKAIANRLINGFGQAEIEESNSSIGFSPFMQAVNKRQLHWIHPEMLKKYGDKDVSRVLTSYIAQGVKRAEYVRRFGNGGEILQAKLEKAHTLQLDKLAENEFGANAKDIYSTTSKEKKEDQRRVIEAALTTAGQKNVKERLDALEIKALKTAGAAAKDVMAMEGTLGYDITPKMRRFQNSMMVYQNMRLLTTSLFSQFIDPLNLVVRGGTMTDAWNAYKRGLREVVASIKGDPIKDLDSKIADQVGTADATHFLAAFGQLHSSQYMGDKFRKANDVLFKYNGMEGFNRGMQVSATRAAINFIKRHVQTPNERSAAYLKELNLKAADVKIDDKGELDYADPVIQRAIHQWVNGSVLRPNAAQRPAWASDPHYMIFWHMKQFAYTFHDVILKRALHDFKKFGDFGPAGVLALTYAPVMIATDALKSVMLTGDEPTWMKGGLDSEINHGVMRAGLMGKFQPFVDVTAPHHNVLGLGGPTVEQMTEMFTDAPTDTAVNALPGANVWNTIKGGGLVDMDEGHTDS